MQVASRKEQGAKGVGRKKAKGNKLEGQMGLL